MYTDSPPSGLITRRHLLETTAAAVALGLVSRGVGASKPSWPIGCFNRAWGKWSSAVGMAGVRQAGYRVVGLISNHDDNPLAMPTATASTLAAFKQQVAANQLTANLTALRFDEGASDEVWETDVLAQLDHAQAIGVQYVMTFGVDQPAKFTRFVRLMNKAAEWAAQRKLKLVLKPHGGISADAEQMERCLDRVAHPNFSLWYDAGNIVHYTGKDPIAELKPIARYVTGFCAKDCLGRGGDVMIQFGTGVVDFPRLLGALKESGFDGPLMVEGVRQGTTPEETTDFARANREFLEKLVQDCVASQSSQAFEQ